MATYCRSYTYPLSISKSLVPGHSSSYPINNQLSSFYNSIPTDDDLGAELFGHGTELYLLVDSIPYRAIINLDFMRYFGNLPLNQGDCNRGINHQKSGEIKLKRH